MVTGKSKWWRWLANGLKRWRKGPKDIRHYGVLPEKEVYHCQRKLYRSVKRRLSRKGQPAIETSDSS